MSQQQTSKSKQLAQLIDKMHMDQSGAERAFHFFMKNIVEIRTDLTVLDLLHTGSAVLAYPSTPPEWWVTGDDFT
jgi:hypothetical protein